MRDFQYLALWATSEYQMQPGLISVEIEGDPAVGLRYRFDEEASAGRFRLLRGLLHTFEPGNNELRIEGHDVVEVWRG
ncbi:MAG: hypothetical protein LWW75_10560 [Chlorobiales bacterium]|nr:hypothetical protein [Chlorobiales bacterium]